MARSRTIKTISALIISMFVGAAILMMVAPAPLRPVPAPVAAMSDAQDVPGRAVYDTRTALQPLKWRNLVIHASAGQSSLPQRCHFIVHPPDEKGHCYVGATELWKSQTEGSHINVPGYDFNAISVGICVLGDFSSTPPGRPQYVALVGLVRELQYRFGISPGHVYYHSDLVRNSRSPGAAFPDISPFLLQTER